MTTTTAAHFDFDDLLTMRPPFPGAASSIPPYHPAALALGSLYFPSTAPDALQTPVPPAENPAPVSLIPDFPQFDIFGVPPAPAPVSNNSHSLAYFGGANPVSTLTPSLLPPAAPAPAPAPAPAAAPLWTTAGSGSSCASIESIETATTTTTTKRRKAVASGGIDKDKLEERRRKNRLSSSKCYYNRKRQIEQVERTLTTEKRRAIQLYARELDLRNENARLKKELVLRNIRIPASFLTTTRTDAFVRPPPMPHGV